MTEQTTELRQRPGDQQLPVPNAEPDIQARVIMDIRDRRELGIQRYGTALQPHNSRDGLRDLYEELLDGACYAKQLLVERDAMWDSDKVRALIIDAYGFGPGCGEIDKVMAVVRELVTAIAARDLDHRASRQLEIESLREHLATAHEDIARRRAAAGEAGQ